ncbi:hypothetical protein BN1723_004210 [Verticillium longisporum]|uniref:phosphatidylserine decarboxylase n=1 Tax=Verticillium longisporum TaxID=100787 RepID=A0A0G4MQ34_VERLO|nr:hypothetical protein BN1723_004210 [Verticillium longisporum]
MVRIIPTRLKSASSLNNSRSNSPRRSNSNSNSNSVSNTANTSSYNNTNSTGKYQTRTPSRMGSDLSAKDKDTGLTLKVVILRARNLAAKDRNGTSDPYLVLTLGEAKVVTHEIPKTLNPEWNVVEEMPVTSPESLILDVICWDKDRFGKDYMGEFDVPLEELFTATKTEQEPKWYSLRSKRPGKKTSFHRLDMSEVLRPLEDFKNFNEFFYRALKPGARPCSAPDHPGIVVSPADCRSVVFNSVDHATTVWIKGREFSVKRLLGDAYPEDAKRYENGALGIFRLAPQDYHRFHIPVDGRLDKPKLIAGEYYTVNPMAIRSALDVYGENVRVVCPIDSLKHGRVMVICVGAMMVGSTVITRNEGDEVKRAEELGYFKFGGSTIVLLFEEGKMRFDDDLTDNSAGALETLVRAGMSIGHSPDEAQWTPDMRKNDEDITDAEKKEAKRRIQGSMGEEPSSGDETPAARPDVQTIAASTM